MKPFPLLAAAAFALTGCLDVPTVGAQNRVVSIGNYTGVTMTHFYASNINRSSWEEDILGSRVLYSGGSIEIDIDDGSGACMFDLKAVFADGDVVVRNDFNVCVEASWTVS